MTTTYDLAVVGAGIVGLAHAYHAARAGNKVILLERSPRAVGASIRNFGMVWPVGQMPGQGRTLALRAREHWLDLADAAGFWLNPCGSLHLAYAEDELAVLNEFIAQTPNDGHDLDLGLLTPEETRQKSPAIKEHNLLGALWSPYECAVDPRQAIANIPPYLASLGVEIRFATPVRAAHEGHLETAAGETIHARHTVIASGDDFRSLYPDRFARYPLTRCKLHMLRTAPQPEAFRIGPHLAGGLTLRHYRSFESCPTLPALKARIAAEAPDLDRYGIHVMAAQNAAGELVLGDSHEYADEFTPDCDHRIEELMLERLAQFLDAPNMTIAARWFGVYAKLTDGSPFLIDAPNDTTRIVNGLGGAGMTLSLALAEQVCRDLHLTETPAAVS